MSPGDAIHVTRSDSSFTVGDNLRFGRFGQGLDFSIGWMVRCGDAHGYSDYRGMVIFFIFGTAYYFIFPEVLRTQLNRFTTRA